MRMILQLTQYAHDIVLTYDVVLTLWTLYGHRNDVVCLLGFRNFYELIKKNKNKNKKKSCRGMPKNKNISFVKLGLGKQLFDGK